jgi:quercetin dioxygenase-like cupin family protein
MMKAVVVAPGKGRFVAVGSDGAGVIVKASDTETGGLCTIWESRIPPGQVGAGPHYHRGRDEFFYVLESELVLRVGEETQTAEAGTFAFIPRGTIHGFHNASRDSATLLVMHHPAGFERFFEEVRQLTARRAHPSADGARSASTAHRSARTGSCACFPTSQTNQARMESGLPSRSSKINEF